VVRRRAEVNYRIASTGLEWENLVAEVHVPMVAETHTAEGTAAVVDSCRAGLSYMTGIPGLGH
jgi:hypothetical protein